MALPLHMDIHRLAQSFRPERWLSKDNKLDQAVSPSCLSAECLLNRRQVSCVMRGMQRFEVRFEGDCDSCACRLWQRLAWACTGRPQIPSVHIGPCCACMATHAFCMC